MSQIVAMNNSDLKPASPSDYNGLKVVENPKLKGISNAVIKKSWFTMAHLVLSKNATVLHMCTDRGEMTYTMAVLNPDIKFIAVSASLQDIEYAQKNYILPNLKFINSDIQTNFIPKESVDAIINSFNLHEIYSKKNSSEKAVIDTLERQLTLLKKDGYIYIQTHVMPPEDKYVLIEMPDEGSKGQTIQDMSEIDLLLSYATNARSADDEKYRGFYLEELPARFPRTRLFRLPEKWAYEFILRKDNRDNWDVEIGKEYTFSSRNDFRRIVRDFNARLLYNAPHWDEEKIKNNYDKKIRLFEEDGTPIGTPETSFIFVIQKTQDRKSLTLQERKPGRANSTSLHISAMRDEYDGHVIDIISRDLNLSEIIPYRITADNKLHVFIHEGIPRCLANTIPRKGPNIDRKQWSGHMTEAFAIPRDLIEEIDRTHFRSTLNFAQDYLGVKPEMNCLFENGPGFYPAPDCIDEHVETLYLKVKSPEEGEIIPNIILDEASGFSTNGQIREINAQQILDAVSVGIIPTSRLEIQILALYEKLGIDFQPWASSPLVLSTETPKKTTRIQEIIAKMADDDTRFKETKGTTGQIKTMQSVFVDEGKNQDGVMGLASTEKDFVINEEESMNTAVVLPLVKSKNGEIMAGIVEQYLPVPQRYKGNGYTLNTPSFNLPVHITNFDMAKKFIAEKFEVPVDCVARMGEAYFSHIGLTPQRIYPFAITKPGASGWEAEGVGHGTTCYAPLKDLYRLLYLDNYTTFIWMVAHSYKIAVGLDNELSASFSFSDNHQDRKNSFVGLEDSLAPAPTTRIKNDYTHD